MYTQSATEMTTMLATAAAWPHYSVWLPLTLAIGLLAIFEALVLWIYNIFRSDAPLPGDALHRKQRIFLFVMTVIGLLIAVPSAIALYNA